MAGSEGIPGPITHRFVSVKQHKLRGEYLRIFGVGLNGFVNVDPSSGTVTNKWAHSDLLDITLPPSEDAPSGKFQLTLHNRDGSGLPFGSSKTTMSFWSPCRDELLTTLRAKKLMGSQKVFRVKKLQRRNPSVGRDCFLVPGESGIVEVVDESAAKILHAYRYSDIESIQRIGDEGVVIVVGLDKRPHAFLLGKHTKNLLLRVAESSRAAGVQFAFPKQSLNVGEWEAMARAYERGAIAGQTIRQALVRKRKNGKQVKLRLTTRHVVEIEGNSSKALSVRSLSRVFALVLSQELEDEMDILMRSEEENLEYRFETMQDRGTWVAHLLDACDRRKVRPLLFGERPKLSHRVVPRHINPSSELEIVYLRRLLAVMAQNTGVNNIESNKPILQKVLQACSEFTVNSGAGLQSSTLSQLSRSELTGSGMVNLVSFATKLIHKSNYRTSGKILDAILRIVDRQESGGLFDVSSSQIYELNSVVIQCLKCDDGLINLKGLDILLGLLGKGVRCKTRNRQVEVSNKKALLNHELVEASIDVFKLEKHDALALCRVCAVFEQILCSGRDSTSPETYREVLQGVVRRPVAVVRCIYTRVLDTMEAMSLILRTAIEEMARGTELAMYIEAIQDEALRSGLLLHELRDGFFAELDARAVVSQDLVSVLVHRNTKAIALLRRIVPKGLFSRRGGRPDHNQQHADLSVTQGRADSPDITGVDKLQPEQFQQQHQQRKTVLEKRLHYAVRCIRSGLPAGNPATKDILQPTNSSELAMKDRVHGLFQMAGQDHELPDLIWTEATREELRMGLNAELAQVAGLDPSVSSWNFEEFSINYGSLVSEESVGSCYLRLLLSSEDSVRQILDPRAVFDGLYNRFLKADERKKGSYLEAMEVVYSVHSRAIGAFEDIEFFIDLLKQDCELPDDLKGLVLAVISACTVLKENRVRLVLYPPTFRNLVDVVERIPMKDIATPAIETLQSLASLQAAKDIQGRKLWPLPRAIRSLSNDSTTVKLCKLIGREDITGPVADLICTIISYGVELEFLKQIHEKGLFQGALLVQDEGSAVKVACVLDALIPYQREKLLSFLPESLICVLERDGPERFADVFLGSEVTAADVIWSKEMRDKLRKHLQHFKTWPMPPIVYAGLDNEIFCSGYFLNRLVELDASSVNVDNPIEVLEGVLKMWSGSNSGNNRDSGLVITAEDAWKEMGLQKASAQSLSEEELNERFMDLASSPEVDIPRLQSAYRLLAAPEKGPVSTRLLVRTQTLLYRAYQNDLRGFEYDHYELVLKEANGPDDELSISCLQLMHALMSCSPVHAEQFGNLGAVEPLLKMPASRREDCLKCIVLLSSLMKTRTKVRELSSMLFDQLKEVLQGNESSLYTVQYALQIVARLGGEVDLQEEMYQAGFVWILARLLFNVQTDSPAKHAARALSRLAGLLSSRELTSPRNDNVLAALNSAFTEPVVQLFRNPNPTELLQTLNSEKVETPTLIWNARFRSELLEFLHSDPGVGDSPNVVVEEECIAGLYVKVFVREDADVDSIKNAPEVSKELLRRHTENPEAEDHYVAAFVKLITNVTENTMSLIASSLILAQPPILTPLVQALSAGASSKRRAQAVRALEAICDRSLSIRDAVSNELEEVGDLSYAEADEHTLRLLASLPFQGGTEDMVVLIKYAIGIEAAAKQHHALKLLAKCPDRLLSLAFPPGLIVALREGKLLSVIREDSIYEPELVWSLSAFEELVETLDTGSLAGGNEVKYSMLDEELCIGDVYVKPFLLHPTDESRLSDPPAFLRALLDAFTHFSRTAASPDAPPPPVPKRKSTLSSEPPPIPKRTKKASNEETDENDENMAERPPPPPRPKRTTIGANPPGRGVSKAELIARAIVHMVQMCPEEAAALATAGHGPRLVDMLQANAHNPKDILPVLDALVRFDSWAVDLAANTPLDLFLANMVKSDPSRAHECKEIAWGILLALAPHLREETVKDLLDQIDPSLGAFKDSPEHAIAVLENVSAPMKEHLVEQNENWLHHVSNERV